MVAASIAKCTGVGIWCSHWCHRQKQTKKTVCWVLVRIASIRFPSSVFPPLNSFLDACNFFYGITFLCQILSDTRHLSNAVIKQISYCIFSFLSLHMFIFREHANPKYVCNSLFSISKDIAMWLFTSILFNANLINSYVSFHIQFLAPQIVKTELSTSTSWPKSRQQKKHNEQTQKNRRSCSGRLLFMRFHGFQGSEVGGLWPPVPPRSCP